MRPGLVETTPHAAPWERKCAVRDLAWSWRGGALSASVGWGLGPSASVC